MKVYQIVVLDEEVAGHGSYARVAKLASMQAYTVKPFPLYKDKAKAEAAAAEASAKHWIHASVMELELY